MEKNVEAFLKRQTHERLVSCAAKQSRGNNSYLTIASCRVSGLCVCKSMFLFYDIGFSCFMTDNKGR